MSLLIISIIIASIGVGFFVGYIVRQLVVRKRKNSIEAKVQKFVEDSKQEAKEVIFKAKPARNVVKVQPLKMLKDMV